MSESGFTNIASKERRKFKDGVKVSYSHYYSILTSYILHPSYLLQPPPTSCISSTKPAPSSNHSIHLYVLATSNILFRITAQLSDIHPLSFPLLQSRLHP
ncbi:hypothetical protein EYC84_008532 [Monilinia fructicola]|uniref:Uncharacterized protein n=1 Tax=Monilinia fructicola TaxID=38448 RepID=A0A5M9JFP0_MONFR|nr:hypothetical protein EYC84_008532 [Monilinia fructicola]